MDGFGVASGDNSVGGSVRFGDNKNQKRRDAFVIKVKVDDDAGHQQRQKQRGKKPAASRVVKKGVDKNGKTQRSATATEVAKGLDNITFQ